MMMVLTSLTLVSQIFFGGLVNLDKEIDESQQEQFRRAVILENLLNAEYNATEVEETSTYYNFDKRRAVLPIEFFVNQDPPEGELGFEMNDDHCYISRVGGLDGENYAYYIKPLYPEDRFTGNPRNLECTSPPSSIDTEKVFSPVMLLRTAEKNPRLPARVYVYSVP
jgi:hypothetical protein